MLLPGTAFVELALRAGGEVGLDSVEELTLEAPLVLREHGAMQLQVTLGAADDAGRRELAVYARPESAGDELEAGGEWVRHASGVVGPAGPDTELAGLGAESWPPEGVEPL